MLRCLSYSCEPGMFNRAPEEFRQKVRGAILHLGCPRFISRAAIEDALIELGYCRLARAADIARQGRPNGAPKVRLGTTDRRYITLSLPDLTFEVEGEVVRYTFFSRHAGKNHVFVRTPYIRGQ